MKPDDQTRRQRAHEIVLQSLRGWKEADHGGRQALLAEHPDLLPELEEEFNKLERIEAAVMRGASHGEDLATADSCDAVPVVPNYELLRLIGQGGFGQVWLARNQVTEDYFAVKVLAPSCSVEVEGLRRYMQQAGTLSGLVPIHEVGKADEGYYYVMPLADDVKGAATIRSLDRYEPKTLHWCYKNQPPYSPEEVVELGAQLLRTLEDLHEAGLTHCDVKPANIIQIEGRWLLSDIGLLARTDQFPTGRGTLEFLPPERRCDHSADLYALAKTQFLLVSGASIYRFDDFVNGRLSLPYESPRTDRLREILDRACHAVPETRYQAARDMRNDLEAIASIPVPLPPRRRPSKRSRSWKRMAIGAIAVALLVAFIFVVSDVTRRVYDFASSHYIEDFPAEVLALQPDGPLLARASRGRVAVQNLATGRVEFCTSIAITGIDRITSLSYSPARSRLAIGGDGGVSILIPDTGAQNGSLGTAGLVSAVAWNESESQLTICDGDEISVWDYREDGTLDTSDRLLKLKVPTACTSIAWSNGGTLMAVGDVHGFVRLGVRDRDRFEQFEAINPQALPGAVRALCWGPDDKYLAIGLSGEIRIWSIVLPPLAGDCLQGEVVIRHPSGQDLNWSDNELISVSADKWMEWRVFDQGRLLTEPVFLKKEDLPDFPSSLTVH